MFSDAKKWMEDSNVGYVLKDVYLWKLIFSFSCTWVEYVVSEFFRVGAVGLASVMRWGGFDVETSHLKFEVFHSEQKFVKGY